MNGKKIYLNLSIGATTDVVLWRLLTEVVASIIFGIHFFFCSFFTSLCTGVILLLGVHKWRRNRRHHWLLTSLALIRVVIFSCAALTPALPLAYFLDAISLSLLAFHHIADKLRENAIANGELVILRTPPDLMLKAEFNIGWYCKNLSVTLLSWSYLVWDFRRLECENTIRLKWAIWAIRASCVWKQHVVIVSPPFDVLLELFHRLDIGTATREVLPPFLAKISMHILRKFLSMNANNLFAEFLGILINHFTPALSNDISLGSRSRWFLLHAKEAHFSILKTLFSIFHCTNVFLKRFQF